MYASKRILAQFRFTFNPFKIHCRLHFSENRKNGGAFREAPPMKNLKNRQPCTSLLKAEVGSDFGRVMG
jgi:hypothetical protein